MTCKLWTAALLAALGCSIALPASAQRSDEALPDEDLPYVTQQEFTSPVTGESFYAFVLTRPLIASSYDFDGCPHPPINTFAYTLVIDPASGYADYPENISRAPKEKLSGLLSSLSPPRFNRNTPEGLPWAGAYPWEKYENAAKLSEANKAPNLTVANWWLQAAWAVRLDVVSGHNDFDSEVSLIFDRLPEPRTNIADMTVPGELLMATQLEQLRGKGNFDKLPPGSVDLALAWLYRSRGELAGAKAFLRKAVEAEPALKTDSLLWGYLDSSMRLEEDYLRTSLGYLEKAYKSGEAGPLKEGGVAFLLAEIERRLGDSAAAAKWYKDAKDKNRGSVNPQLVERQLKLTAGRGY